MTERWKWGGCPRRPCVVALIACAVWSTVWAGCHVPAPVAPAVTAPAAPAPMLQDTQPAQWDHDWVRGAVFYEIFVRSFADADGDGIGDLRGLTAHLDYLNDGDPSSGDDLGVDAVWLMPVFESPSYHGYDVVDYERIERDYGTGEDFDRFLEEAHRRGIRVIVDLVVNHTSSQHPWFEQACCAPDAPYRSWYVWRRDDPGWTQPWGGTNHTWHPRDGWFYYGVFWGGMPDLEWRTPAVREEMARIADFWLARGVDGFRLDATRHLVANGPGQLQNDQPETHLYLKELAAHVRRGFPASVLVGENWTDTATIAPYYGSAERVRGGDELPMSFDFPLSEAILGAVRTSTAEPVEATLDEVARLYPPGAIDAPFLTNHDQVRLATQLAGDPASLRLAASILLTLPGAPFLYYGEEIGLPNGPGRGDEFKRTPLPWDGPSGVSGPGRGFTTAAEPWFSFAPAAADVNVAAQVHDPDSLFAHYRALVRLRHASKALAKGDVEILARDEPSVLAYLRRPDPLSGGATVLVAHNLGSVAETVILPFETTAAQPQPQPQSLLADPGTGLRTVSGELELTLAPRASGIWRLPG